MKSFNILQASFKFYNYLTNRKYPRTDFKDKFIRYIKKIDF